MSVLLPSDVDEPTPGCHPCTQEFFVSSSCFRSFFFGVPVSVLLSFCLRLSHFGLSWRRRGWRQGLKDVALAVMGKSAIYSQPDNAAFDMTVQSAHRLNQVRLVIKRST